MNKQGPRVAVPLTGGGTNVDFGSQDNFAMQLDDCLFGAIEGQPMTTVVWNSIEVEFAWLRLKEQYYRLVAGRIRRYIELREGELAKRE